MRPGRHQRLGAHLPAEQRGAHLRSDGVDPSVEVAVELLEVEGGREVGGVLQPSEPSLGGIRSREEAAQRGQRSGPTPATRTSSSRPTSGHEALPADLAARMPRSEFDLERGIETIHVDGQTFERRIPTRLQPAATTRATAIRDRVARGNDPALRLEDLDQEGIWAELIFPSIGFWMSSIDDPDLLAAGCRAINDWAIDFQRQSARFVCTATIPLLTVETAVAEVERSAALGYKAAYLSVLPPREERLDPRAVGAALGRARVDRVSSAPSTSGPSPTTPPASTATTTAGRAGRILNYMETTYGGQRAVSMMIASGVFDRHPGLRVMVSEGGATWGPFVADRLDEAYRQHASAVRPTLRRLPSEYLYEHVYASFQHDRSAPAAELGDGLEERLLGQRLPAPRGHVRPLAEDAARAVRRRRPRDPRAHHRRRVRGAVPARAAGPAVGVGEPLRRRPRARSVRRRSPARARR